MKNSNPVVMTTHGKVKGEDRNGVAIFRGIPYGGSCNGERRFLPPVPAENWEGVRDCTKNGFYAVQYGTSISGSEWLGPYFNGGKPELFGVEDEQQDENCLVLNVLTPGIDDSKRAVLVYIHGGGFASGSGTLVLGGNIMAQDEDIVLVGINHRLNIFGYMYLGELDSKYAESGMAGMLDLVLALEWVRDNISHFGGDPEKVTIMGESGGGMKVSTLLAMNKAKGLFRHAIVESGSSPVGTTSMHEAAKVTESVLEQLGISRNNFLELLTLPAEKLLEVTREMGLSGFEPVADEINLEYNAHGKYIASEISKDIPLLIGASEDEAAVFSPPEAFQITWDSLPGTILKSAGQRMGAPKSINADNIEKIIEVFKKEDKKGDTAEHIYMKIISLSSFLGGEAHYQAVAKAEQGGAPVYYYMIAFDSPHPTFPDGRYSWHTADLPLKFRIVLHPECEDMSIMMSKMWANFVKSGNPSIEGYEWPVFTASGKQVMVFDDITRVETDPYRNIREALESL
jgi:para-nitrobenzyl esterase